MNPIKVLLDARKLGDGGIGIYIENLVEGLLELKDSADHEVTLTLLVPFSVDDSKKLPSGYISGCIKRWRGRVSFVFEGAAKYSIDEYFSMPRRLAELIKSHDVFHSPHYTLPFGLEIPSVVTIHDVIHVTHPDSLMHEYVGKFLIRSALHRACEVITVSEQSSTEIQRIAPRVHAPISVIPNAFRPELLELDAGKLSDFLNSRKLTRPYCLFIGTDRPHKGFVELIEAWRTLFDLDELPDLVVVGEKYSEESKQLVESLGMQKRVKFVGKIPTHELSLIYHGARAAILPSREEGFGFVALEAMGCGVPVISTPLPSVREICGELAWYSEDFSTAALAKAIRTGLIDAQSGSSRIELGRKRALSFSRRKTAAQTLEIYRRAATKRTWITPQLAPSSLSRDFPAAASR